MPARCEPPGQMRVGSRVVARRTALLNVSTTIEKEAKGERATEWEQSSPPRCACTGRASGTFLPKDFHGQCTPAASWCQGRGFRTARPAGRCRLGTTHCPRAGGWWRDRLVRIGFPVTASSPHERRLVAGARRRNPSRSQIRPRNATPPTLVCADAWLSSSRGAVRPGREQEERVARRSTWARSQPGLVFSYRRCWW